MHWPFCFALNMIFMSRNYWSAVFLQKPDGFMAAFTGTSEIRAKLISICRSHRKTKEALPQMLCGFFFFYSEKRASAVKSASGLPTCMHPSPWVVAAAHPPTARPPWSQPSPSPAGRELNPCIPSDAPLQRLDAASQHWQEDKQKSDLPCYPSNKKATQG